MKASENRWSEIKVYQLKALVEKAEPSFGRPDDGVRAYVLRTGESPVTLLAR
jgi:hypothetical protein